MPTLEEHEYLALMKRGQEAERGANLAWTAGALTAAVVLSWAISARSPGLMIPVVFAIATGFYGMLRGRQQARAVASYVVEFHESSKSSQWFSRLGRLQAQPAHRAIGDWVTLCLANAGVVLALVLSWVYAGPAVRGDLMAGITTGCGLLFAFHSISEMIHMEQTDWSAMWRSVSGELKEASGTRKAASW